MSISVAQLPFYCVSHPQYDLRIGEHVFPARKYSGLVELLRAEKRVDDSNLSLPEVVTREQIELVHTPAWTAALLDGTIRYEEVLRLEIPYSRPLIQSFLLHAGGSIAAGKLALRDGVSMNLGGGFHHAFPTHGEGFCPIHDVAIAIRELQAQGQIERAMVIDTDVHHGNGTAAIFAADASVFTLSIHQENNYPAVKPPSDLDIGLEDGTGDDEYLSKLRQGLGKAFELFAPQLVAYIAGSDPYRQDKLGGLNLSLEGMYERDFLVAQAACRRQIPLFGTLAGGYATEFEATLRLHANTAMALAAAATQ